MKKYCIFLILLCATLTMFAQDETEQTGQDGQDNAVQIPNLPIGIGPYLAYGLGVNMTPAPDGRQSGIVLYRLPDAGVHIYMPISSTAYIGLASDVGFTNYGYMMSNYATGKEYVHHFGAITFNPGIMFRGFILGYTLGIPIFADYNDSEIDITDLNTQHGVTLEYLYPIWGDNDGRISVFGKLTYMFTNVFENYMKDDPLKKLIPESEIPLNNSNSPRFASIMLGFSYTFNLFNAKPAVEEEQ